MLMKNGGGWTGYDVEIEKRIISQTPLNKLPCSPFDFFTCQENHLHSTLINGHGCWFPMFYSGKRSNIVTGQSYPECSRNAVIQVSTAGVLAFHDFLFQREFMKCGDHEL